MHTKLYVAHSDGTVGEVKQASCHILPNLYVPIYFQHRHIASVHTSTLFNYHALMKFSIQVLFLLSLVSSNTIGLEKRTARIHAKCALLT